MPDDTSPHGGEAMHPPPDRATIPQPKPGQPSDEPVRGQPGDDPGKPVDRPPIPTHTERMAADVEDEEADPVIDSGPGIADEPATPSVTRQPG